MPKKDLRQLKKKKLTDINKDEIKKAAEKANINIKDIKDENIEGFEEVLERYGGKSETELMGDLEEMVSKGRQEGTFSDEMLEAFAQNVLPMMDEEQREKLETITSLLKMNKI